MKPSVRLLIAEDDADTRRAVKETLIEEFKYSPFQLEIGETDSIGEAEKILARGDYDMIIADLNIVGVGHNLTHFVEHLRSSITTREIKVLVFTGMSLNESQLERLVVELRVIEVIFKPNIRQLIRRVKATIKDILDERTTSSGLLGWNAASRAIISAIEMARGKDPLPAVIIDSDILKIGMSANDFQGRVFGNTIINLLAEKIQDHLAELCPQVERKVFEGGRRGDDFVIVMRGPAEMKLNQLTRKAEWLVRGIGLAFDRSVRELYPSPYREWGILLGKGGKKHRDIVNKEGRYVVLPLPAIRFAVLPVYEASYEHLEDVNRVINAVESRIKATINDLEWQANSLFGLPAVEFPRLSNEEFNHRQQEASRILKSANSQFMTASFTLTQELLEWKGIPSKKRLSQ